MASTTAASRSSVAGRFLTAGPLAQGSTRFVWWVAGLAVAARLPFVALPAGADEAGFLQVAHQWGPGGGSLYGHYWVDRPPLLISLYQLADRAGGLVPLRLLGCVAVALTVVAIGATARRLGGDSAARWAAVLAAALLVSPLLGSQEVNGELLAAPFVAAGFLTAVAAVQAPELRSARVSAGLCGAAGICALMVKQNIIDVFVFASVLAIAGGWRWADRSSRRPPLTLVASGAAGACVALGMVAAWTTVHGTSLVGVFDAIYPFRLRAAAVVAAGGSSYAQARGVQLLAAAATSGVVLLLVAATWATARRGAPAALGLALGATVGYDAASIALGGGYWLHYLVEMVVPLAVWAGVLAARGWRSTRLSGVLAVAVAAVAIAVSVGQTHTSTAQDVGASIGRVARPGDSLTTLYGDASVNFAAGLPSPYPHLWSLPIKTLDPQLTQLDAVLTSADAPTWLVVSHSVASWGLDTARTQSIITSDYRPVAQLHGQTVYLHDGLVRGTPTRGASTP